MSGFDVFSWDGKRAVVVGGASGMGLAAAQTISDLGGELIVLDRVPVDKPAAQSIVVDLRDREAIDAAIAQIEGPVHAIISAAGVADGTEGIMRINFIAHRHIIEALIDNGTLVRGGSVAFISSVAGLGWEGQIPTILEFLATPDFESADAWVQAHEGTDSYFFSKQAVNTYVAHQAYPFLTKGVRINAICPGPTDTPLARANADMWLGFAQDYRDATGTEYLTPEQMGNVLAFLCSDAASGISGINLLVDSGHVMSSLTGSWEAGQPIVQMLMGR
jgi:NAD(P)-dependent dehydrogenase (short-subunit alcohol dehydrogenase family)